jgi:hypothetical protein
VAGALATEELMLQVFGGHDRHHFEPLHVARVEIQCSLYVPFLHLAQTGAREMGHVVNLVLADHARERHVSRHEGEFNVHKFGNVDTAVLVAVLAGQLDELPWADI